ncbi:hypothetical protein G4177_09940 [Corallococcus sp. ZKHCc1 1396]|uniref:HEAT repeat domain-containing protein n=2 Tax=Myxococcaceae TaxID=31 RepID=A0ABR9PKR8_9BACT|nr:hypothetical protein [Corallococcus soli]
MEEPDGAFYNAGPSAMRLQEAQKLLDRCFTGTREGAPRLHEPSDPRFSGRGGAVWLEYRWYVRERGMAEVFLKWDRVSAGGEKAAEATVLRTHLLGQSPMLSQRALRTVEGGTPAPERILDVLRGDGIRRECVARGRTTVTVEHWESARPTVLLDEARFEELAAPLEAEDSTPESRHEAVQRLSAAERSPRVVDVLLRMVARRPSLMALRILSEWGEVKAREFLQRDLAALTPGNAADLWALTALDRRFEAWEALARPV